MLPSLQARVGAAAATYEVLIAGRAALDDVAVEAHWRLRRWPLALQVGQARHHGSLTAQAQLKHGASRMQAEGTAVGKRACEAPFTGWPLSCARHAPQEELEATAVRMDGYRGRFKLALAADQRALAQDMQAAQVWGKPGMA